jgi:endonuclease/exonuclease/phosphatase (EEP) superfamily protein YafD
MGICNALFSNLKILDNEEDKFYYSISQKSVKADERTSNRENYFLESEFVWKGIVIKIVCVHVLFSRKVSGVYQQAQIRELIDRYSHYERVIICGDWNTGNNNYKLLQEAGFTLANDGKIVTYPSKNYPLDNIAVKGLKISDVRAVETDLSDHYPLVCKISLE